MSAEVEPVDLDEVLERFRPARAGVIEDPQVIEGIRARRLYGALPFWIRWRTPRPEGWREIPTGPIN